MLVKERLDGGWTLPGGWVDVGEPPSRAVEQEIREDPVTNPRREAAGVVRSELTVTRLIFSIPINCIFSVLWSVAPARSIETDGAEFFAEDALPELSVARTTKEVLHRMFEHLRHPELRRLRLIRLQYIHHAPSVRFLRLLLLAIAGLLAGCIPPVPYPSRVTPDATAAPTRQPPVATRLVPTPPSRPTVGGWNQHSFAT